MQIYFSFIALLYPHNLRKVLTLLIFFKFCTAERRSFCFYLMLTAGHVNLNKWNKITHTNMELNCQNGRHVSEKSKLYDLHNIDIRELDYGLVIPDSQRCHIVLALDF